jgi:hypothetical protein
MWTAYQRSTPNGRVLALHCVAHLAGGSKHPCFSFAFEREVRGDNFVWSFLRTCKLTRYAKAKPAKRSRRGLRFLVARDVRDLAGPDLGDSPGHCYIAGKTDFILEILRSAGLTPVLPRR